MKLSRLRAFLVALLLVATNLASTPLAVPYEIAPLKDVHETMTLKASDCLRVAPRAARPSICSQSPEAVMNNVPKNAALDLNSLGLGNVSRAELANSVKWPDDPTSQIAGPTLLRLGLTLFTKCKDGNGESKESLLCRSHFGDLQFWHAMASSPQETTGETQRKMLAWAEFLYEVAVGDVPLTEDYCAYWDKQRQLEGKSELAEVLAPKDAFPCPKDAPPWTIGTLLSLRCRNVFRETVTCTERLSPRVARVQAIGALMHIVQDSFAQGHAKRGECEINPQTKKVTSKFECLPISQFYSYSEQNGKKHAQADAPPQPGRSCSSTSTLVDEPILASANVLWFVQQKKGGKELVAYLKARVFPLADSHQTSAGPGDCFAKAR
jgi:hypothetical protein